MAEWPLSQRRHTLVRISPPGWREIFARTPRLAAMPFVLDWAAAGHPLIVRRPNADDERIPPFDTIDGYVPVGLATPPAHGKKRLCLRVLESSIVERTALPPIERLLESNASASLPVAWVSTLHELARGSATLGVVTRVYGSLLWQYVSGVQYVSAGSDADLLWSIGSQQQEQLRELIDLIARLDRRAAPRIDGEILIADKAVSWRELARAREPTDRVLAKTDRDVMLCERRWLFEAPIAPIAP